MERRAHWENVYATKNPTEVSWFEREPQISLELIHSVATGGRIIDVGGGASLLVDRLLAEGRWDVTVLDISGHALDVARQRLKDKAVNVRWLVADITAGLPSGLHFDVWHDRAVFHFLTDAADRERYLAQLKQSLLPGGHLIIGAFAPNGPDKCSGLPVCRYDAEALRQLLGAGFQLRQQRPYAHTTPAGKTQQFTFAVFQRQ